METIKILLGIVIIAIGIFSPCIVYAIWVMDKIKNIEEEETKDVQKAIKKLQQENKQLQERIQYLERSNNRREDTIFEQSQKISDLEDNWNKLKEWASNFYNSEEVGWAGCGMRYTLEKILELENETANNYNDYKQCKGSDSNE